MMLSERHQQLIRQSVLPASLCLISLLLQFFDPDSTLWLRYERSPIINNEWWRLLSGNFVHLGWTHLWMNLAGLALIWILLGRLLSTAQWLLVIIVSSLAVGIGLLAFNPQLDWYVGLSGMLHGLFVAGLVNNIRRGLRLEWLLLIGLTAKLIWEQYSGALPGSTELAGGLVIVDAHLYGAIGGMLASVFIRPKK